MRFNMSENKIEKQLSELTKAVQALVEKTVEPAKGNAEEELLKLAKEARERANRAENDPLTKSILLEMKVDALASIQNATARRNRQNKRYGNINAILRDLGKAHEGILQASEF